MTVPVVVDLRLVLRRLAREEETERRELGRLAARLRRFEDVERPAYEQWLRLELGPAVTRLDELAAALRARQTLAARVTELVEDDGLHPREALYVLQESPAAAGAGRPDDRRGEPGGDTGAHRPRDPRSANTPEEVEARRRAKRDRKRAERKQAQRATGAQGAVAGDPESAPSRRRLVALYRDLARSLHPDSPRVLRSLPPIRLRAIWAEVQAAYAMRSLERLLALATWVETVAETGLDATTARDQAAAPMLSLAERHDRLRALRRASRVLDRRLATLTAEPAWDFATTTPALLRKVKRAAARRLATERTELESALQAVDDFLDAIGPPRPPRATRRR